jgi:hypothetical protein
MQLRCTKAKTLLCFGIDRSLSAHAAAIEPLKVVFPNIEKLDLGIAVPYLHTRL